MPAPTLDRNPGPAPRPGRPRATAAPTAGSSWWSRARWPCWPSPSARAWPSPPGRSRSEAQYLTTWVRNQNPRLRTLPMASGVVVKLWGSCEESSKDRDAAFNALAELARQNGTYHYTLTVAHGKVQRIQERLAINAC